MRRIWSSEGHGGGHDSERAKTLSARTGEHIMSLIREAVRFKRRARPVDVRLDTTVGHTNRGKMKWEEMRHV